MISFFKRLFQSREPQPKPRPRASSHNKPAQESVVFKAGVKDVDFGVDMGGWQGRITKVHPEDDMVTVAFDSVTLRAMPLEYIEECAKEGLDWTEYRTTRNELEPTPPRDALADVRMAIAELRTRVAYSYLGEEGQEMNAILAGVDPSDGRAVRERWGEYLSEVLSFPFDARVVELLYTHGPIRYNDRLRVIGINGVDESYAVLTDVKRGKESYVHPVCDLETIDPKSPNHDPLQLYRVWFANR